MSDFISRQADSIAAAEEALNTIKAKGEEFSEALTALAAVYDADDAAGAPSAFGSAHLSAVSDELVTLMRRVGGTLGQMEGLQQSLETKSRAATAA